MASGPLKRATKPADASTSDPRAYGTEAGGDAILPTPVSGTPEPEEHGLVQSAAGVMAGGVDMADSTKENGEEHLEADDDRRRYDRTTVLWNGKLLYQDEAVDCVIVNIGAEGAMVQTSERLPVGTTVILKNDRFGTFAAKVVWDQVNQFGLQFLDDKEEIAQTLGLILP